MSNRDGLTFRQQQTKGWNSPAKRLTEGQTTYGSFSALLMSSCYSVVQTTTHTHTCFGARRTTLWGRKRSATRCSGAALPGLSYYTPPGRTLAPPPEPAGPPCRSEGLRWSLLDWNVKKGRKKVLNENDGIGIERLISLRFADLWIFCWARRLSCTSLWLPCSRSLAAMSNWSYTFACWSFIWRSKSTCLVRYCRTEQTNVSWACARFQ